MSMVDENDPLKGLVLTSSRFGEFLCGRGFHKWRFLHMTNVRYPTGAYIGAVCDLTERCKRSKCRIRRTRKFAKLPKRVKT